MMYFLVLIQQVIVWIVSDFDILEVVYDFLMVLDWIGDVIEYIGVFLEYSEKVVIVEVENFCWVIFCDLLEVSSVEYKGYLLVECLIIWILLIQNIYFCDLVMIKSFFQINV